jgi:methionyl aminopeptidase
MAYIKTEKEIEILKEGGKRLAQILKRISKEVKPGISTKELNSLAEKLVREGGDVPAFLGYKAGDFSKPYPSSLCVSVNEEVVHGLPSQVLEKGDIVTIDLGLIHGGLFVDAALTVGAGHLDRHARKLVKVTEKALDIAIEKVRAGNKVGEISFAIEEYVKSKGFVPAEGLGGHGVGHKIHEEPFIPNIGPKNKGVTLKPGMVLAIEPIINEGGEEVYLDKDGFTYRTVDNKRSAQFEHTVLITKDNPVILTEL